MRYGFLLFVLLTRVAMAQTLPVLDQNPPKLHWYQLRTPHFRVIYPDGFDQPAQQTARRLEQVYGPVSATLERPPRPVSIVLQNQTTISNGFVTLLPRHSEFFASPPQDPFLAGTLNWLDLLAVHEFRHVVQYEKGLQGFSRFVYTIFGNAALAGLSLGIPDWFAEGDAVGTETALTFGGRGRIANFDLGMRANLLAKRPFNYPKAVGGSFRDNVPNHYVLGYFLTTYLKRTYGANAWSQVLNRYYRFPLYPFSFSNSLKRTVRDLSATNPSEAAGNDAHPTRLRVQDLYRRAMADVSEAWYRQQETLRLTPGTDFRTKTRSGVFTNYQYPQYVSADEVLAVKSGLGDISQLVVLNQNGDEKKVFVPGLFNNPEMFSAEAGKACWVEFRYDPRYTQRVYSDIKVLDLKTRKLTTLTQRGRYMVATLSPDGRRIVGIRNETTYQTRLVVLDAQTGQELYVATNPNQDFYQHPRWFNDQSVMVVAKHPAGGKSIQLITPRTNEIETVMPVTMENISNPLPWQQYILYNSSQSGIDNIYGYDRQTGRHFQVTSRPLGAYHAAVSPDGKRLSFHDFRASGYRIVEMPLDPTQWTPVSQVPDRTVRYFGPLLRQEPGGAQVRSALADSVPAGPDFTRRRYGKLAHAINIYSWGPLFSSDGQNLTVGLQSQDLLNTTQISAGLRYNQAEQAGSYYTNVSYQGWFPIFDVGVQGGRRNTSLYIDRTAPLDSLRSDSWHYDQLTAGVRLPLQLTRSKYRQSLSLSAYYTYLRVTGYDLPVRPITEVGFGRSLNAVTYGFSYSRLLKQSKRDVAPRWGQTLSAVWRTTPFGRGLSGDLWSVQGSAFVPGLGKHHSLRLRGGYQQQSQGSYRFGTGLFFPRGLAYVSYDKLATGSVEYRLPLLNPHWTIGRLVYIQRVKATGFYDTARGESLVRTQGREQTFSNTFSTAGVDLSFVFNVLRLRTPFEAGVRSIYNVGTGRWLFEPLVVDIGF